MTKLTIERLSEIIYPIVNCCNTDARLIAADIVSKVERNHRQYASIGIIADFILEFKNGKIGYTCLIEKIYQKIDYPELPTRMDSDPIPTETDTALDGGKIILCNEDFWRVSSVDVVIPHKIGDKSLIKPTKDVNWMYGDGRTLSVNDNMDFYSFCLTQKSAGYIINTFEQNGNKYFNIPATHIYYRIKL